MAHGSVLQHISQQKSAGRTWSIQWNSSFPGRSSFCWVGNYPTTSWWFQPILKICSSNWIISLGIGVKIKNTWNHHLAPVLPSTLLRVYFGALGWNQRNLQVRLEARIFGDFWWLFVFPVPPSFWMEETSCFFLKFLQIRIFNDYNPWYLTSGYQKWCFRKRYRLSYSVNVGHLQDPCRIDIVYPHGMADFYAKHVGKNTSPVPCMPLGRNEAIVATG